MPAGVASGQTLVAPFDGSYTVHDLGQVPGVPDSLGGLTLKAGTTDRLLIGGGANDAAGALYEVGVVRDGSGHIVGFSGSATRFADAANNDGGVTYGPGGVLFLARWPLNELGQTKPGSAITDKIIALTPLGIESSLASLQFVPQGQPGAGSLKLASYRGGAWYDADVVADGAGTYDLANVREIPDSRIAGGPEGFVYVPSGSPQFSGPSLLVSEYGVDEIAAYQRRRQRRSGHRDAAGRSSPGSTARRARCSTRSPATSCSPPSAAAAAWSWCAASARRPRSSRRRWPARPSTRSS